MAKPYSEDLRDKAIKAVSKGNQVNDVCNNFSIGRSTLYGWLKTYKATGSAKPKTGYQSGHGHKITDVKKFKQFVDENRGLTGVELAEKWGNITPKTMRLWLHRIGYSCKKKVTFIEKEMKKSVKNIWKKSKK